MYECVRMCLFRVCKYYMHHYIRLWLYYYSFILKHLFAIITSLRATTHRVILNHSQSQLIQSLEPRWWQWRWRWWFCRHFAVNVNIDTVISHNCVCAINCVNRIANKIWWKKNKNLRFSANFQFIFIFLHFFFHCHLRWSSDRMIFIFFSRRPEQSWTVCVSEWIDE